MTFDDHLAALRSDYAQLLVQNADLTRRLETADATVRKFQAVIAEQQAAIARMQEAARQAAVEAEASDQAP